MPEIDEYGRPHPEPAVGELETLLGFLDYQRATLEWKARGVDDRGMIERVSPSTMTLAGLLHHMAWVEEYWFSHVLHDRERSAHWQAADFGADPDWDWNHATTLPPDDVRDLWSRACTRSRADVEQALANGSLDQLAARAWPNGESASLRWILVHMIEEYARHNGHADLLREAVDGERGE